MNDDIHALIGAFAVVALGEAERARFEDHLAACEHCRGELVGLQAAAGELSLMAPVAPPAALRASVLAQIGSVRPLPPVVAPDDSADSGHPTDNGSTAAPASLERSRARHARPPRHALRRWAAAAVAAAALVVGGLTWHPWTSPAPAPVSAVQQVLHAPDARRYVQHAGATTATVVRSQHLHKSVLVARGMAPAPAGHTYQLWYLTPSGKAVSAGLAPAPSDSGNVTVALDGNADTAAGVGVTVEPAGGSPQPTTKPIMVFTFTS